MPFQEDPQMRLQQWGANLCSGFWDLSSELRGTRRPLTHAPDAGAYAEWRRTGHAVSFGTAAPFVDESRAVLPAWTVRGVDAGYSRWEHPWLNPQAREATEKQFLDNVSTRLLLKQRGN